MAEVGAPCRQEQWRSDSQPQQAGLREKALFQPPLPSRMESLHPPASEPSAVNHWHDWGKCEQNRNAAIRPLFLEWVLAPEMLQLGIRGASQTKKATFTQFRPAHFCRRAMGTPIASPENPLLVLAARLQAAPRATPGPDPAKIS